MRWHPSADLQIVTKLLTAEGKKHVLRMLRELAPLADGLESSFRACLSKESRSKEGQDAGQMEALLGITPAAASRCRSLACFQKEIEASGRRLARFNVSPETVNEALEQFDRMAAKALAGRFAPAREQLRLATRFLLNQAFYDVREAESQAFFGLFRAETEAADLDDLLARFVRVLARAFGADAGRLWLEEQQLFPGLDRSLYIRRREPAERSIRDPKMRGRHACYWSYPFGTSAVLQLGFATARRWLPREEALLAAAAARCEKAIERGRMAQQIRRLQAEALHTEEEERRRIGRDLHDEAGQALAFLRLQLEMIERDAPEALRPRLYQARDLAARTAVELRRIVAALSPSVLERLGLETALRLLVKRLRFSQGMELAFRASPLPGVLPRQTQEVVYRVAQECLLNVAKHSRATHVNVSLRCVDKKIRLSVRDNGAGFCADQAWSKPKSFGLTGMRERAALLGGTLAIRSMPGRGTGVVLDVPAPVNLDGKDSCTAN